MRNIAIYMAYVLSVLVIVSSCVSPTEHKQLRADYDSLVLMNLLYQDQVYETDSLVASIVANYLDISNIEGMINVNSLNPQQPASEQQRIRGHVKMLSDRLEESNNAIETLIQRLENNKLYSERMQGLIAQLKARLLAQKERSKQVTENRFIRLINLESFQERLKNLHIQSLRLGSRNESERLRLCAVEDSLNVVYYALGTKYDLREMRLLNKQDKVSVDNAELSYLTRSDRRELRQLNLMSKTARLLTIHPRDSYEMNPGEHGALQLVITDPKSFWAYSHILLVEVDF